LGPPGNAATRGGGGGGLGRLPREVQAGRAGAPRPAGSVASMAGGMCCICLEGFGPEAPERRTVCGHGFHLECIREWSVRSGACPLCARGLALADARLDGTLARPTIADLEIPHAGGGREAETPLEPWEAELALQRQMEDDVLAHLGIGGAGVRREAVGSGAHMDTSDGHPGAAQTLQGRPGPGHGHGLLKLLWRLWGSGPKGTRRGLLAVPYPGAANVV